MPISIPDTNGEQMCSCPFKGLYLIVAGPDTGDSMIIFFNDMKGISVNKCHSCTVDGPSVTLMWKLQGPHSAMWFYWYTKADLGLYDDCVSQEMSCFSSTVREV